MPVSCYSFNIKEEIQGVNEQDGIWVSSLLFFMKYEKMDIIGEKEKNS